MRDWSLHHVFLISEYISSWQSPLWDKLTPLTSLDLLRFTLNSSLVRTEKLEQSGKTLPLIVI